LIRPILGVLSVLIVLAGAVAFLLPSSAHPTANAEPKPVQVGEIRRFEGSAGEVTAVAFSPDGSQMISGGADKLIRLWDVKTGQDLRRFEGHTDSVTGVAFSPDGKRILSGSSDKTVRLWDAATGKELRRLESHTGGVLHVCFSPDGQTAASGSWDHTARLWNLSNGEQIRALEHGDFVVGVAFSPDGRQLATGSWDHLVRLWDVKTGEEVRRFEGHTDKAGDVAFAADGTAILSGSTDQTLRLWDVKTGRERVRCDVGADAGWAVAISPDGRRALSVHDADVILWDLASAQELHRFKGHGDQVMALAFAPDGRTALSSSRDGSIRLWGLPSESETAPAKPPVVAQLKEPLATREAVVQATQEKPRQTKVGAPESPEHAPEPTKFETVKLDDGTEVQIEKWGKTYPAYEYHPPVDILDRSVHVVLDGERDGVPQMAVNSLAVDSQGGWLYWCEGRGDSPTGRVMRSRLDGTKVQVLATDRVYPHGLVLDDQRRGWLYWLEGAGEAPSRLQAATPDGKEMTLSKGLNRPGGLALDSARGQLYYWEQSRLVRINVDGTGEEILMANPRAVSVSFGSLAFDAAQNRIIGSAAGGQYQWFERDKPNLLHCVPWMENCVRMSGFAFDEDHQKIYFADLGRTLRRANLDGTQIEALVVSPAYYPDEWSRTIGGDVALDPARGQIYWTGGRIRGGAMYAEICRMNLPPLPEPTERPAPPRITAVEPAEQASGGEVMLSGDGLAGAVGVRFIDDSTGMHVEAKFRVAGEGRLAVTVPQLGKRCKRPLIVVQTPSGVTMTLGTDVQAPKIGPVPYKDVLTVAIDKERPWWLGGTYQTDRYKRSATGMMVRLWLRPGVGSGATECAVVYAQRGSSVIPGAKGMVTAFAKDNAIADTSRVFGENEVVIYHEPFAFASYSMYYNTTVKRIPVPAIRPSFPEQTFRYRGD
jgi:dipeptidyl aminopeptidase/acylaminoacyl peptidase